VTGRESVRRKSPSYGMKISSHHRLALRSSLQSSDHARPRQKIADELDKAKSLTRPKLRVRCKPAEAASMGRKILNLGRFRLRTSAERNRGGL